MKKYYFILVCFAALITCNVFAKCDDEKIKGNGKVVSKERILASFDKINLAGNIDIVIDQNGKEAAVVETDENIQEIIITEVKNGSLNVHVKENVNVKPAKLIVYISCNTLSKINSGGSGDITSKSKIKGDAFTISHGGSGDMNIDFAVKKLKINTAGSGDYILKGNADEFNLNAAGSGNINAKEFICTSAKLSLAGSGDVILKKGSTVSVSQVGSGKVIYQ